MPRYIEKLRAKSESARKTIALLISLCLIIAIFIAWLSGLAVKSFVRKREHGEPKFFKSI